ncbi:Glycosyl transferase, family 1 [Moorella glycerini]|uniref:Glycosyltransferase EpsD n=1 Tax=Neomoorella stamsii TaxID=1266720 RepID=A0A9X7P6K6_9FIRM|nr:MULTISPECIES: glycosyltransferase family 4 protein [Moorella]PRR73803.1 putative glycosyltransferase EpsD [Moorella stamsii]CEP67179.1 Glycosyl transferase, family 1 [Moorella glycerini]
MGCEKKLQLPYRVARVITRLNIGGPAIHTTHLTERLNNDGLFDSMLVCGSLAAGEGGMEDFARQHGVEPFHISELGREISLFDDLKALRKLYRLFRLYRPVIVHSHTAKAGTLARVAARLARVPVIVHTFHGHVFSGYFSTRKTKLFILIERFLAHLTDAILVLSPEQQRDILGFGIGKPGKVKIVPLGIDLEPYLHGVRGRLRAELGLAGDVRLIGIVGRLTAIKNHNLFLKAAKALLDSSDIPLHFVVVGDGELRQELEDVTKQLDITEHVTFLGWRKDMPDIYRDLDVLALTSNNEGTPVTIIEAMAAGCPVVATRVGGVPDMIQDGVTGMLVEPGDVIELGQKVMTILENKELAQKIADAARDWALATYSIDRLEADIRKLYLDLLRAKGLYQTNIGGKENGD